MIAFLASGQVQLRNTSAMSSGQGSKAKGKKAGVVPKTKGNESIQATPHSDMNSRAGPSHALVPYQASQATQENTMLGPKGYTVKPIVPAKNPELISVAKAMHRDEFGIRVKELFDPEREAALDALQTGIYIGWRCPEYNWDCIRVGVKSKCFCGHPLAEHEHFTGCTCSSFESNFLCAACDKHWEQHHTFFETERNRKEAGLPYGEAYLPFAEMPNLRNAVLSGNEKDDSAYQNITSGTGPYSRLGPSSNSAGPVLPSNENTGEF
ncbi:protein FAM221B-like isoform X3 [Hemitrygon akajei]|uniref:protein FAM221B-like isoform X3 n=1 Tax=Hemitrygon akajei TaxID=2704970 RepID=UPI003BF9B1A8